MKILIKTFEGEGQPFLDSDFQNKFIGLYIVQGFCWADFCKYSGGLFGTTGKVQLNFTELLLKLRVFAKAAFWEERSCDWENWDTRICYACDAVQRCCEKAVLHLLPWAQEDSLYLVSGTKCDPFRDF